MLTLTSVCATVWLRRSLGACVFVLEVAAAAITDVVAVNVGTNLAGVLSFGDITAATIVIVVLLSSCNSDSWLHSRR